MKKNPSPTARVFLSLLSIVVLLFSQLAAQLLAEFSVSFGLPAPLGNLLAGILYASIAAGGLWLLCHKLMAVSMSDCRITKPKISQFWAGAAFALPAIVCVILILTPGQWELSRMDAQTKWAVVSGAVFYIGLAVGLVEEMVFRGVIFSALEHRFSKWTAILVPSVAFGLLHIIGAGEMDFLSICQLVAAGSLVGVLFSLVTLETGSIWSAALMHGIWNMVMIGSILNIGEEALDSSLLNYVLKDPPFWLSGGDFGIEASAVCVAAYLFFAVITALRCRKKGEL